MLGAKSVKSECMQPAFGFVRNFLYFTHNLQTASQNSKQASNYTINAKKRNEAEKLVKMQNLDK